jgi:hypothetical protein
MILTCSNPGMELAVLGNPGRKVIKYDWTGVPKSKRKALYQLAERWSKRKSVDGPYSGVKVGIRRRSTKPRKVVGHPRTGRVGSVDFISKHTSRVVGTNPMRRFKHYVAKLNPMPAAAGVLNDVKALPGDVKGIFAKPITGVPFALGGAAVALTGGAIVTNRVLSPLIARMPASIQGFLTGAIGRRVLTAALAYGLGKAAAKYAPVSPDKKRAIEAGAVAAALIEAIRPGLAGQTLSKIPYIGQPVFGAASSVQGLGIYMPPAPAYDANGDSTRALTMSGYESMPAYTGSRPAIPAPINGLPGMGAIITANDYTPSLDRTGMTPMQADTLKSTPDHFLAKSFFS